MNRESIAAPGEGRSGISWLQALPVCALVAFNAVLIQSVSAEGQLVLLPMMAILDTGILFLAILRMREGAFPLEVGTLFMAALMAYAIVPLLGFLLAGLAFSALSDLRLMLYDPDAGEIGAFAWKYVYYTVPFAVCYLLFRGGPTGPPDTDRQPPEPMHPAVTPFVVLLGVFLFINAVLQLLFGIRTAVSYEDIASGRMAIDSLPLFLRQLIVHFQSMMFTVKLAVLCGLIRNLGQARYRWITAAWLSAELLLTVARMGGRAETVLLLVAAVLLYHWTYRPIRTATVLFLGVVVLGGFLAFGIVRDAGDAIQDRDGDKLAAANEFQALFSTGFDLHKRLENEAIAVPATLYFSDFTALVPSQLLPFPKTDGAEWYLELLGLKNSGVGLAFGVLAESAIGFGNAELVLRGGVVGLLFALAHRYCSRRRRNFTVLLVYAWFCCQSYHSFRSTTFHQLLLFQYHVLPVLLLAGLIRPLISGDGGGVRAGIDAKAEEVGST